MNAHKGDTNWDVRLLTPIAKESCAPTNVTFPKLRSQSSACPLHIVARGIKISDASADPGWALAINAADATVSVA